MSGNRTGLGSPAQLWSQRPSGLGTLQLSVKRTFALRDTPGSKPLHFLHVLLNLQMKAPGFVWNCCFSGGTCGARVIHKGTPCWWRRTTPKQRPTKTGWAGLLNHALGPNHTISRMHSVRVAWWTVFPVLVFSSRGFSLLTRSPSWFTVK